MAETIKPLAQPTGGSVDVSRTNDSGISSLAHSLNVGIQSAASIAQTAQENELRNVHSLLQDSTMGPDEAKEIAGNAFFPINRFMAQNRAGEVKVHAARDAIEADLVNAVDSIDARQRLRVHQQELLKDENDLGVQAGIRQAVADLGEGLINKASAKRLELRNMQRRDDESFILKSTLTNEPEKFTEALQSILTEQNLDATQVPDIHKTAGQTMLNTLIENPDMLPFVKQAARDVLSGGTVVNADDRAQYAGVLKAVQVLENAANSDNSATKAREAQKYRYGIQIVDAHRMGLPSPPGAEEGYLASFKDPVDGQNKLRALKEAGRQGPIGMIDTDAYKAGKKSLELQLKFDITNLGNEFTKEEAAAVYEVYDAIMGSMDPQQVQGSGDSFTQAQAAADMAMKRGKEFANAKSNPMKDQAEIAQKYDELQEAALAAGDDEKLYELEMEKKRVQGASGLTLRRARLRSYILEAQSQGLSIHDLRP